MQKISGIYKIANMINGKMYVGQSLDIETRIRDHVRRLNNKKHDNDYLDNKVIHWNLDLYA